MDESVTCLKRIEEALPEAAVSRVINPSPSGQHSLLVEPKDLLAVARFLRDDPQLVYDFLSNLTGVDWLDRTVKNKVKKIEIREGEETELDVVEEQQLPGCLEVVFHLYSLSRERGPLILRTRTVNRTDRVSVPSLVSVWRSAEFQEREVYDLYGVVFEGHPDLRRLLMWDEFEDHPMRKDYIEPDDYEYEPTPHGRVLEKLDRS